MSEVAVVKASDLSGPKNPTSCWSALRGTENCHKCKTYLNAWNKGTLDKMQCIPRVKAEVQVSMEEIKEYRRKIREMEQNIREVESKISWGV